MIQKLSLIILLIFSSSCGKGAKDTHHTHKNPLNAQPAFVKGHCYSINNRSFRVDGFDGTAHLVGYWAWDMYRGYSFFQTWEVLQLRKFHKEILCYDVGL